jgi:hypothetical protein
VVEALCRVAGSLSPTDDPRAELIRRRDVALLECLRSSGLRVSEAVSLRREHFNLADPSAVVRGKGGKDRVVFFSQAAVDALRAYWAARGDEVITRHTGSLPAFARHNGPVQGKVVGLTEQGVRYIVEELRKRAGAEWPVTPHRLRAWFATHLLDSEVNLAEVQDLMGHESANTTRIYTKVHPRRLQEAHRRANVAQLHREIVALGFPGSRSLLSQAVQAWRGPRLPTAQRRKQRRMTKRLSLRWYCLCPPDQLKPEERELLDRLLAGEPELSLGYKLLQAFREVIAKRHLTGPASWLADAKASQRYFSAESLAKLPPPEQLELGPTLVLANLHA